jgi:hypothetical protein
MMVLGSLAIVIHLVLAFIMTLNVPSGPWPTGQGSSTAMAPKFIQTLGDNWLARNYQNLIRSNSSFRFGTLRQEVRDLSFEAHVLDDQGVIKQKFSYPDAEAPAQVRYRQKRLAEQLDNDDPLPPQQGVIIPPPGEKLPTLRWWQQDSDGRFVLKQGDANAVPRNQNFNTPSVMQMIVAQSYARFLARHHGASRLALQRNWNDPVMPMVLIIDRGATAEDLRRVTWSYGELNP